MEFIGLYDKEKKIMTIYISYLTMTNNDLSDIFNSAPF